jgi:hypothetical protein
VTTAINAISIETFLQAVDRAPDLRGIRVVYFDGMRLHVLREGPPSCASHLEAVVLREPIEDSALHDPAAAQSRDAKLLTEILGAGLSCTAAALGWIVALGFTGAAPLTGGSSLFVAYLSGAAAAASTVQCISAGVRVGMEIWKPETLDTWDDDLWYQRTAAALDAISLAGAVTAASTTIRLTLRIRATTGRSMIEVLKGLTRQQRRQLAEEAVRLRNPGISTGEMKVLVQAGVYPKRFTTLQISKSVQKHIIEALGASFDVVGSATNGILRQGGRVIVGMTRSLDTY